MQVAGDVESIESERRVLPGGLVTALGTGAGSRYGVTEVNAITSINENKNGNSQVVTVFIQLRSGIRLPAQSGDTSVGWD
jgi:hypothetical protein